MAPAQKDTLRKLQAEAYLSVLRAVAASELDWVRRTFDEERQGDKNEGSATAIVFFLLRRRSSPPTALSLRVALRRVSVSVQFSPSGRRSAV